LPKRKAAPKKTEAEPKRQRRSVYYVRAEDRRIRVEAVYLGSRTYKTKTDTVPMGCISIHLGFQHATDRNRLEWLLSDQVAMPLSITFAKEMDEALAERVVLEKARAILEDDEIDPADAVDRLYDLIVPLAYGPGNR